MPSLSSAAKDLLSTLRAETSIPVRGMSHAEAVGSLELVTDGYAVLRTIPGEQARLCVTDAGEAFDLSLPQAPKVTVAPAWTIRREREVRDGWDVLVNGEWNERYPTKREAERAAKKLQQVARS